jgi:hypothetical protein
VTKQSQESRFTRDKISLNKREVRERLYDDARDLLRRPARFGMLAGGHPKEEVDCIRLRFFRPEIVAFDLRAAEVEAAKSCGVEAVRGNIAKDVVIGDQEFDFFNLDLCGSLSTAEREIASVARRTRSAMSVFVSFGMGSNATGEDVRAKERAIVDKTTIRCERASHGETTISRERAEGPETTDGQEQAPAIETATWSETTTAQERAKLFETTNEFARATVRETTKYLKRVIKGKSTKDEERAEGPETTNNEERVNRDKTTRICERAIGCETTNMNELARVRETTRHSERASGCETTNKNERANMRETTNVHELQELPDTQLGRVLLLHDIVRKTRPDAQIARVYVYRGNAMMMLGALFVFSDKKIAMLPPFCTVKECATDERRHRLRGLGVGGEELRTRLKNGEREGKRRR